MYIRKTSKRVKGKTYFNYLLVESFQTPKGPRQRTVCSLGDLSPRTGSEWLKLAHRVESSLAGEMDLLEEKDPEVESILQRVRSRKKDISAAGVSQGSGPSQEDLVWVHTDRVETRDHREGGSVHVGNQYWRRLDLDSILEDAGLDARCRELTCAMTMNRLIHPTSEHAMPDWIRATALSDILRVDFEKLNENPLYENLDKLHENRCRIESSLVERERTLFTLEPTVFFYDLTSTYFEGLALRNSAAKRGYSRDKRPDCKQVVVGLVVDREGFPQAHEVFDGNMQDRQSLGKMLGFLDRRVGLQAGQTVVVDRGMSFQENLEEIKKRKLHYVVAARQSERDLWLESFEDVEGFEEVIRKPSPLNPFQKKPVVKVKSKRCGEETHVLCWSEGRVEKDRAIRQTKEKKLLSDLSKLKKRIAKGRLLQPSAIGEAIGRLKERYPSVVRYYHIQYDENTKVFSYEVNKERLEKAEILDGCYLLKTDRHDLSAKEAWRIYITLTRAESAFRSMKSPLAERPIFHQIKRRVETHIFLCVLAYHLLVAIEKTLLDKGVHTSWATVREMLKTHQVCTVILPTDDGRILKIRKASTPETHQAQMYDLLGISKKIMRPVKTWGP